MEIRQMLYFKALAEELNLFKASEKCYITQQALSKSMRILEAEMQTEIFYRDHGKLKLTTFGMSMLQEVSELLSHYEQMMETLENHARQEKGVIKIAFSVAVIQGKLEDYLNSYDSNIRLDLIELPDVFCEQYVLDEKCDLGFAIGVPNHEHFFDYTLFKHNKLCAMMKKDHPYADRKTLTLNEVSKYPLIMKNQTYKSYEFLTSLAKKEKLNLKIQTKSLNTMFQDLLKQSKDSIAIGTTYLIKENMDYVCVPFEEEELNWDIYIITKKGHYLSDKAKKLIDSLLKIAEEL